MLSTSLSLKKITYRQVESKRMEKEKQRYTYICKY